YDLMHLGIFALTAIFFWKWIIVNAGFVLAFDLLRRRRVALPWPILVMGCVLVLVAPSTFHIVRLGWFDSGGVNEARFEARTASGNTVRVPSNYFLDGSITAAQRLDFPFAGGHLTGTWATTAN